MDSRQSIRKWSPNHQLKVLKINSIFLWMQLNVYEWYAVRHLLKVNEELENE